MERIAQAEGFLLKALGALSDGYDFTVAEDEAYEAILAEVQILRAAQGKRPLFSRDIVD